VSLTPVPIPASEPASVTPVPSLARRALEVPLLWKILAIDSAINVASYVVFRAAPPDLAAEILIASLIVTLLLNGFLVYWALVPLRRMEETADRVSRGDLAARVRPSLLADRDIARIGRTLNAVLDHVMADRVRLRQLAAQVIRAGDEERARIGRELHDSAAQSLGAVDLMLGAAAQGAGDPASAERLRQIQRIAQDTLAEVRVLSHHVYPRVLDDLGLVAALEWLARSTREQTGIAAHAESGVTGELPRQVAAVLYRVAQEAVRNVTKHSDARTLSLRLAREGASLVLTVQDDGRGFDPELAMSTTSGLGLFTMRERVALVDGDLTVTSRAGEGTRLVARVPMGGGA
jgi:signal transduction histidine kinase